MKRNPAVVLLLSLVTCGLYSLYLIYAISREVRDFRGDSSIDPMLELVLTILTCGLYEIYWYYKFGRLVFDMQNRTGVQGASDLSLVLLLLPLFGFGVISMLLLQNELNRVWDIITPGGTSSGM
ncbi:MAG: DUF4234 domain-containing protein [Clostridia bacterium]|nr:DUF4234 domain-containing protein [Clostridia bacterium]